MYYCLFRITEYLENYENEALNTKWEEVVINSDSNVFAALPQLKLKRVRVTGLEVWIQWKFDSSGWSKQNLQEGKNNVGVQIKYKKESDKEYLTYPEDGGKLTAEKVNILSKTPCIVISWVCSFCWNLKWTHKNLRVQAPQNF